MYKVTNIIRINAPLIICEINNSDLFSIDIQPLIHKHQHFDGIENLKNENVFNSVKIGELGELCWENLIKIKSAFWNYDISPEFIVAHGTKITLEKV